MKKLVFSLALLGLIFAASGCGDNVVVAMCEKFDSCNAINQGFSLQECTELYQQGLDDMTEAKRTDCEAQLAACNERQSCDAFLNCDDSNCR